MSRSEAEERDAAFASGSAAGPSNASEHPPQRRERPDERPTPAFGYPVEDPHRPHLPHDWYPDTYAQRSANNQHPPDFPRTHQHSPSREWQYHHELEVMTTPEEQERSYGGPSSRSGRPAEMEQHQQHPYSGVSAAARGSADEFGPRPTSDERPSLEGFSRVEDGKRYRLVVVQHPSRARMCGFGDKDRRPLSPTLIVKLIITDEATGEEFSPLVINTSLFLLATDLCHPDDLMLAPRNILVHHHASSLPVQPMQHGGHAGYPGDEYAHRSGLSYGNFGGDGQADGDYRSGNGAQVSGSPDSAMRGGSSASSSRSPFDRPPQGSMQFGGGSLVPGQAESYTRNLVGAAVASASVLKDEQDKWCIFFVFQDISVRTEGVYRIKLMFVNLEVRGRVGTGVAEALAETYTEPFTVHSPRRFPGMLDPTPLSRKLASQGIKIPVRNDKKKQRRRNDDGDNGGDGMGDYDGGSGGDDDDD
ncbi:uncharacterized protein MEPE_01236 [Melanopsichium pennsylvanicum]|uniref:Velvet domain-containing protein n=2 Tax=Melanopsichium pennsylvanicum TaxID=63383 RepID=A0AAJ5C3E4_9BASI|nr:uncharacterized protein MEPE_01236 [Melanopsichium pennsylvanicum]